MTKIITISIDEETEQYLKQKKLSPSEIFRTAIKKRIVEESKKDITEDTEFIKIVGFWIERKVKYSEEANKQWLEGWQKEILRLGMTVEDFLRHAEKYEESKKNKEGVIK